MDFAPLAFPAVVLVLGAVALWRLTGPARDALVGYARRQAGLTALEAQRAEGERQRLELDARKLELERQVLQLAREKGELELVKLKPPALLPEAERDAVLDRITRDAYLLTEQTAKNNKANGVVLSPQWKLGEATRQAREALAGRKDIEVTPRELALRLEVQVVEHDPHAKNKPQKKPQPSSVQAPKA